VRSSWGIWAAKGEASPEKRCYRSPPAAELGQGFPSWKSRLIKQPHRH
jgi:hypothetical protein